MRHIVTDHIILDMDTVFIISPYHEQLVEGGTRSICIIRTPIFQKVQNFVKLFDDGFKELNKKDANGNTIYWEQNWHDHYVDTLMSLMPGCQKKDISNALSALGY